MIGLSLGVLGVFYFYLQSDETAREESAALCGTEQACDTTGAEAESIELTPEQIDSKVEDVRQPKPKKTAENSPKRKRAQGYKFLLIDTTGDGRADSVDVDLDGVADYVLGDADGDGFADFADLDGDTISDVVFYDDDKDGVIESFDIEMNQKPNGIFVDKDGDGFPESASLQSHTEICYERNSGIRQMKSLTVKTATLSDYISRGAKIGSCESLIAKQSSR